MEGSGTRRVEACPGEEYCSYVSVDFGDYDYSVYGINIEVGQFSLTFHQFIFYAKVIFLYF